MDNETNADAIDLRGDELIEVQPGAIDYLSALTQEYDDWKQTLLRRSNDGLYDVLAKCLRVYEIMSEDGDNGERLRRELAEYIKSSKLKFNGDTHTVVKIARIVFAADSKKASAYGMVLRAAIERGIGHTGLADFIRAEGGIESIRLQRTGGERETVEDRAERAYASVKGQALAIATGTALKVRSDMGKAGSRVVLLATLSANGECTVHAVVQADSAVNAAFAAHAAEIKKAAGTKVVANEVAEAKASETQHERAALRMKAARELLAD